MNYKLENTCLTEILIKDIFYKELYKDLLIMKKDI